MKQEETLRQRGVVEMADIQAVVLCGGLGTRLRSVVPNLPKSLAPIAGRPFLDYLLGSVAASGMRKAVLCTGHGKEALEQIYSRAQCGELKVIHSFEDKPLGTAGALRHALRTISSNPFVVFNGDSLLEIDLRQLVASHLACGALATLALTRVADGQRYGSVTLEANGEIAHFSEKADETNDGTAREGTLINAGIYVLEHRVLEELPSSSRPVSLERDVFPALVGRGLFGFACDGFFIDIGVPEDYQRAKSVIPRRFGLACSHPS